MPMTPQEMLDHTPLRFGKYRGKTPNDVAEDDPSWLVWAYENVKDKDTCSPALYRACQADVTAMRDDDPDDDGLPDTYEAWKDDR